MIADDTYNRQKTIRPGYFMEIAQLLSLQPVSSSP